MNCYRFALSKGLLSSLLLVITLTSQAEKVWMPLGSSQPAESKAEVLFSNVARTEVRLRLSGFYLQDVQTSRGSAVVVQSPGGSSLLAEGAPDLPKFAVPLIIPNRGGMQWRVMNARYKEYSAMNVAPSKGNLLRTVNPSDVPYRYGSVYNTDAFFPSEPCAMRDPYVFRDFRGQTLLLQPFRYNPVTRTLLVLEEMQVEVVHSPTLNVPNPLPGTGFPSAVSSDFAPLYKRHFANYPSVQYIPVDEGSRMLIICPGTWMPLLQPLVDWKTRRGMEVEVVDVTTAGSTAPAIQQFIAGRYVSSQISFVLLVGDAAQVPTLSASGGASDPSYGFINGQDSYAEVIIGRFSAETDPDVATQVQRVIDYERYPDPSGTSFGKGVVVASDQGPGDDNEYDWEHAVNMRSDLIGFTYTQVDELYDGTQVGTTDAAGDPSNMDLFNLFQSGIGLMTYTGHGSSTSCATTGLSNNDVQNMTNTGKLPFIWSVACVNGEFDMPGGPCFAEKFLRAQVNGQPTGAVATLMSSINQSWNPPMDGQDEMVDILAQSYPGNMKFTFGGISVNGCMHMNDTYGSAGADMTNTWHCFGDPSLLVRTATPISMTVSHLPVVPLGTTGLLVNCSLDEALVALTLNGQLLATAVVSNGVATLNFNPLNSTDTLHVTVTGFNALPYEGNVLVIPLNGPYVLAQQAGIAEPVGNGDGAVDYSETIHADVQLQNIGPQDAVNVQCQFSTSDPYVNLLSVNPIPAGTLAGNSAVTLAGALQYEVAAIVPDQHVVQFTLTLSDSAGNTWSGLVQQVLQAPVLEAGMLVFLDSLTGDGDGQLEPGETAYIIVEVNNTGHSDSPSPSSAGLQSSFGSLVIINGSASLPSVPALGATYALFQVALASNVALGTPYTMDFDVLSGGYSDTNQYAFTAGVILEDFETNDFSTYSWTTAGVQPWITTPTNSPYEGVYHAQSGSIAGNQTSELLISVNALANDSVSFWHKESSEQDWDFLKFYIDGTLMGQWSGITAWSYASYPVIAGTHQLRFVYEKDAIVDAGLDLVWLDNIRFPFGTTPTTVSVVENQPVAGFSIRPNPVSDQLTVLVDGLNAEAALWTIHDVQGRLIRQGRVPSESASQNQFTIPVLDLDAGCYLLKIECDGALQSKRFVVSH